MGTRVPPGRLLFALRQSQPPRRGPPVRTSACGSRRRRSTSLQANNPQETNQPVFAFLSFYAVHSPIQTTQAQWRKYRDKAVAHGLADKGYQMGHFLPIRQVQDNPVYAGLLGTMDEAIGMVLTTLEELGLDDNTIVVFTSDNGGGGLGRTRSLPPTYRCVVARGYQFEGGIREPYFIKGTGPHRRGQVQRRSGDRHRLLSNPARLDGQRLASRRSPGRGEPAARAAGPSH